MLRIGISMPGGSPALLMAGLQEDISRRTRLGLLRLIEALKSGAQDLAPYRTGSLMMSIEAYFEGGNRWELAAWEDYASYICEGTGIYGPHGKLIHIRPRKKKALWWEGAGHPVFSVTIRGIRPYDFMGLAIEEADMQGEFDQGFRSGASR